GLDPFRQLHGRRALDIQRHEPVIHVLHIRRFNGGMTEIFVRRIKRVLNTEELALRLDGTRDEGIDKRCASRDEGSQDPNLAVKQPGEAEPQRIDAVYTNAVRPPTGPKNASAALGGSSQHTDSAPADSRDTQAVQVEALSASMARTGSATEDARARGRVSHYAGKPGVGSYTVALRIVDNERFQWVSVAPRGRAPEDRERLSTVVPSENEGIIVCHSCLLASTRRPGRTRVTPASLMLAVQ